MTLLQRAVQAAQSATRLALVQYNEGSTDFTTVITAQTSQYTQESNLTTAAGTAVQQLINLFRALGGGWTAQSLPLPKATITAMKKRTNWHNLLNDMDANQLQPQP